MDTTDFAQFGANARQHCVDCYYFDRIWGER